MIVFNGIKHDFRLPQNITLSSIFAFFAGKSRKLAKIVKNSLKKWYLMRFLALQKVVLNHFKSGT